MLTTKEAAKRLGMKPDKVRRLCQSGQLPSRHNAKSYQYEISPEDVAAFKAGKVQAAEPPAWGRVIRRPRSAQPPSLGVIESVSATTLARELNCSRGAVVRAAFAAGVGVWTSGAEVGDRPTNSPPTDKFGRPAYLARGYRGKRLVAIPLADRERVISYIHDRPGNPGGGMDDTMRASYSRPIK